jgi:hypothetical protein
MPEEKTEIVIPREKATFRLDGRGRWHNAAGPFRNPRIIEFFNSAIRRDAGGYFVGQERDGWIEKVYFPCEDTAFFVREAILGEEITLVLNTRNRMTLDPAELFIQDDSLYLESGGERIKFTEQAMLQLADAIEFTQAGYFLSAKGGRISIPERPACSAKGRSGKGP